MIIKTHPNIHTEKDTIFKKKQLFSKKLDSYFIAISSNIN